MNPDLTLLTDAELEAAHKMVCKDLGNLTAETRHTEWHDQCFAALVMVREESTRRLFERIGGE